MSHLKERKEKVCLNCHTALIGRYCHVCGQENLEPKETVWHLVQHFFNDITHFDGKFFSTVKYLLKRPGFLSKEYMNGRRASYLNPIRMYVFTSAIFFVIFFSMQKPGDIVKESPDTEVKKTLPQLEKMKKDREAELAKTTDGDDQKDLKKQIAKLDLQTGAIIKKYGDTTTLTFSKKDREVILAQSIGKMEYNALDNDTTQGLEVFGLQGSLYPSVAAYDSSERALPDSLRDGWLKRTIMHKLIVANDEFRRDKKGYYERFGENLLHSFPKILFVSLPFFALILNILYFRRKKTFYYVSHGIFTIHVYCATFLLSLAIMLLTKLKGVVDMRWFSVLSGVAIFLMILYLCIYLYKAMRGFYGQGRFKTFVKYCLVCLLAFIVNTFLLVLFVLISAISI